MPTKTQKQDQKVAAFKEIGLSLLCAHKSITKPNTAKAVKMICDHLLMSLIDNYLAKL